MPQPALQLRGLSFSWPGRPPVLADLDLTVAPGELVALLGPNGAGKSTLLKLLVGPEALGHLPYQGELRLSGDDARRLKPRHRAQRLAWVPQQLPTDLRFSVEQLVRLGRYPHLDALGRDTPDGEAAVERALTACALLPLRRRLYAELSGGERQRAVLAGCLAQQAPLLLLDEPTSALDLRHTLSLLRLLRDLADQGHAVLLASHDLNRAAQIASRLVVLHEGRIAADGPPADVLTPDLLARVYGVRACLLPPPPGGVVPLIFPLAPADEPLA